MINGIESMLGYIAGTLTSLAFIPQVIKVYKTKNTKALSLVTIILFFIGQILWALHGKFSNDFAVLIFACITGILYIYLIYAKLKYG